MNVELLEKEQFLLHSIQLKHEKLKEEKTQIIEERVTEYAKIDPRGDIKSISTSRF